MEHSTPRRNNEEIFREFQEGFESSLDPQNLLISGEMSQITTQHSSWRFSKCNVCKHTFRKDDVVWVGSDQIVIHDSSALPCKNGGGDLSARPLASSMEEFYKGMDEMWPPSASITIKRLEATDPQVAHPFLGSERQECAVCGHTLRVNDIVVICPCKPNNPGCQTAIHRDPIQGLFCYSAWNLGRVKMHCPSFYREIR